MKILVVEDEPEMMSLIKESFEKEQYIVETATDYDSAAVKIGAFEYDLIILDITLPGGNGLNILNKLKKMEKEDGVLIVSAKNSLEDKLKGLDLGADDYLTKPFHIAELHARANSILRRRKFDGNKEVVYNNLTLFPDERLAYVEDSPINLHRKEFDILLYLIVNKKRLVTKSALAEHVWGDYIDGADDFEFIYSQVKNLRKKLKEQRAQIEIQAVYGVGYKLTIQ